MRVHVCTRQLLVDRRFRFDHVFGRPLRARAPTTRPRLWCATGSFHPALTCQSAVPGRRAFARAPRAPPTHLNGKTSPLGSSSDDYGSRRAVFLAFSKNHLRRSQNRVYQHDHAVSIDSADRVRVPFPRTGCGKQKPCKRTIQLARDVLDKK